MERPRAHSVLQFRPTQSTFHVRASKLLQKVSAKFTRGIPGPEPTPNNSPYMQRGTYSVDGAKPYMSQPMLGLGLTHEAEDSDDGSASPARSEGATTSNPTPSTSPNVATTPSPNSRPPPPSRAPPPLPPGAGHAYPVHPIYAPINPTPPLQRAADANANANAALPTRTDSLRRSRSQTLAPGCSRTSAGTGGPEETGSVGSAAVARSTSPNTTPSANSTSMPPLVSFAFAFPSPSPSSSTLSSTSSYATARSPSASLFTLAPGTSSFAGLPTLDRFHGGNGGVSGLPYAMAPTAYTPTSYTPATTPAHPPALTPGYTPSLTPSSPTAPAHDARRVSLASFVSGTSVDSFATARSRRDDDQEGDDADDDVPLSELRTRAEEGGHVHGARGEARAELVRQDTLRPRAVVADRDRERERERADTLRAGAVAAPIASSGKAKETRETAGGAQSAPKAMGTPSKAGGMPSNASMPLENATPSLAAGKVKEMGAGGGASRAAGMPSKASNPLASTSATESAYAPPCPAVSTSAPSTVASGAEASAPKASTPTPTPTAPRKPRSPPAPITVLSLSPKSVPTKLVPKAQPSPPSTPTKPSSPESSTAKQTPGTPTSSTSETGKPVDAPPTPTTADAPLSPQAPRRPARAATLPPLATIPLIVPAAPVPVSTYFAGAASGSGSALDAGASSSTRLSPSPSPSLGGSGSPSGVSSTSWGTSSVPSPWGTAGFAPASSRPRARVPSTPATGTVPPRRTPTLPPALQHFSMTFNPSSPTSSEMGRLSPSVVVRQPPLAIPVLRLPVPRGERPSDSPSVGRRSSVIFGPAHGREASKAVVRSMPALGREGTAPAGPAAGESDDEGEGEGDDIEDDNEMEDQDEEEHEEDRPSVDAGESPFVPLPLRLDMSPLALDLDFGAVFGGKGKGKERELAPTPGAPLAIRNQLSQGSVMSNNTITRTPTQGAGWHTDYFAVRTPTGEGRTPMLALPRAIPMPASPLERPGLYKHASRSMVDILSVTSSEAVGVEKGKGKDDGRGEAPAYEGHGITVGRGGTLRRRRSMPEIMATPPPYTLPPFSLPPTNAHPLAQARIVPRDDEGREVLPAYSNAILLRGVMPRKMEFTAPGVQAKDRKWRRVVCELEGTVFRVYRVPGEGWWERTLGAGDVAASGAAVSNAAAVAAAAIKARAGTREGQEGKIADEERVMAGGGESSGAGTTQVTVPASSSVSFARSRAASSATSVQPPPSPSSSSSPQDSVPASRSRLNLGLTNLLKPRAHGRSKSDLPDSPRTPTASPSRSSLSIPRPSFNGSPRSTMAPLAPSRSNASVTSSRSGLLTARTPPATPQKNKGKSNAPAGTELPEPDPEDLIRAYTLQHGESGLGNDYLKRKHVIRLRLEGEQFLLQARDVGDVVDWIEGLHSASDIALDLDERVMPKGPIFPRRRRRRPRTAEAPAVTATNVPAVSTTRTS